MNELAERLAADGVIIEECDIPSAVIPKVPFPVFYMKHNRLPVPVLRHFRPDYSKNLKTCSPNQRQYSLFPRQPRKCESKHNLIFIPLKVKFSAVFEIFVYEVLEALTNIQKFVLVYFYEFYH